MPCPSMHLVVLPKFRGNFPVVTVEHPVTGNTTISGFKRPIEVAKSDELSKIELGSEIFAINDLPVRPLSREQVADFIAKAPQPISLRIIPPGRIGGLKSLYGLKSPSVSLQVRLSCILMTPWLHQSWPLWPHALGVQDATSARL